mmetsp:Transcript_33312/g.96526  ORF Transcript_33312/g.96526 Transcript_33312/m.96526 type:complete len:212 (+) Transcript_33312:238-873(+)
MFLQSCMSESRSSEDWDRRHAPGPPLPPRGCNSSRQSRPATSPRALRSTCHRTQLRSSSPAPRMRCTSGSVPALFHTISTSARALDLAALSSSRSLDTSSWALRWSWLSRDTSFSMSCMARKISPSTELLLKVGVIRIGPSPECCGCASGCTGARAGCTRVSTAGSLDERLDEEKRTGSMLRPRGPAAAATVGRVVVVAAVGVPAAPPAEL